MKIFNRVLLYFQLLGICVISIDKEDGKFNLAIRILNVIHTFLSMLAGFFIYYFESYMFYVGDTVTRSSDIVQVAVPVCAYFIIVFHAGNLRKNDQMQIWENFTKVNFILVYFNLDLEEWKSKVFRKYTWKLFFWVISSILIYVQIMRKVYEADSRKMFIVCRNYLNIQKHFLLVHIWFYFWCLAVFPYIVCQSSIFYYCLYVDLLKEYLILINEEIRLIGIVSKSINKNEWNLFYNLKFLKEAHNILCDVNSGINGIFGWSHLVNVTAYFIVLTVDIYWIYFHIKLSGRELEGNSFLKKNVLYVNILLLFQNQ